MHSFITSSVLLAAVASATSFGTSYKATFDSSKPGVTIHNRCGYKLWAWSVAKESGCPSSDPTTVIEPGSSYSENYRGPETVSIKLSGTDTCEKQNITQIEYTHETSKPGFNGNYVDVSYVDCESGNCPSRRSGFWYKLGNHADASGNIPIKLKMDHAENCPIWSCKGLSSDNNDDCKNKAYVAYNDDLATRFCALEANWEIYLCDPAGPDGSGSGSPAPAPSSNQAESASAPSSQKEESKAPASSSAPTPIVDIKAAAVTKAPEPEQKEHKTKYETVVVTTTVVEEAKAYRARRHIHGHQRHGFHA